jgi:hypothetical protein
MPNAFHDNCGGGLGIATVPTSADRLWPSAVGPERPKILVGGDPLEIDIMLTASLIALSCGTSQLIMASKEAGEAV